MQVVSTVVCRKQLLGVVWVSHDRIKIDHAIEFTAATNPVVNLLTYDFPLGSIKSRYQPLEGGVLKRRVCGPNNKNALAMAARDEVTIAGNNVVITYLLASSCAPTSSWWSRDP